MTAVVSAAWIDVHHLAIHAVSMEASYSQSIVALQTLASWPIFDKKTLQLNTISVAM